MSATDTNNFSGKAIYRPKGKAGEYARWAANLYVGCSNGCSYCYCKKGVLKNASGNDMPMLKKCFKDETHAIWTFRYELLKNKSAIIDDGGIFFSFTTDPCLLSTWKVHYDCILFALAAGVPVTILTKCVGWIEEPYTRFLWDNPEFKKRLCIGFTLTGMDELEPDAASNDERIKALQLLSNKGIKTFASIEPVIDIQKSLEIIIRTRGFVDLYKIGLLSGEKRNYGPIDVADFVSDVLYMSTWPIPVRKVYFKDNVFDMISMSREKLQEYAMARNLVNSNFNIFE